MAVDEKTKGLKSIYSNERISDEEKMEAKPIRSKESDDPFGDESNSEIKYKTMAWW